MDSGDRVGVSGFTRPVVAATDHRPHDKHVRKHGLLGRIPEYTLQAKLLHEVDEESLTTETLTTSSSPTTLTALFPLFHGALPAACLTRVRTVLDPNGDLQTSTGFLWQRQ